MNTTTALTTIQQSTKPPLTQKELLRATAIAMAKDNEDKRKKQEVERSKLKKRLEIVALKAVRSGKLKPVKSCYAKPSGYITPIEGNKLEVELCYFLDLNDKELNSAFRDWRDFQISPYKSVDSFYEELRKKTANGDRVNAIVANEQSRKLLAEAGKKILGMTTPQEAASAIEA